MREFAKDYQKLVKSASNWDGIFQKAKDSFYDAKDYLTSEEGKRVAAGGAAGALGGGLVGGLIGGPRLLPIATGAVVGGGLGGAGTHLFAQQQKALQDLTRAHDEQAKRTDKDIGRVRFAGQLTESRLDKALAAQIFSAEKKPRNSIPAAFANALIQTGATTLPGAAGGAALAAVSLQDKKMLDAIIRAGLSPKKFIAGIAGLGGVLTGGAAVARELSESTFTR